MLGDLSQILGAKPLGTSVTVGQIAAVGILILLGYLGSRLSVFVLNRRLANSRLRPDAIHAISRVVFWLILIVVFLTALSLLHVPLTAFAFVTGAIAIGVGFGTQNILNNFISGIHRTDGVPLLVPNSSLLEKIVINWTLVDKAIRTTIRVGVAYGSPVKLVAQLIEQAVLEQDESKNKPNPVVVFEDFGDSALIFDAYFWCDVSGERELRTVRSNIRFRIVELFEQNNIGVAFPQLDVHIAASKPLALQVDTGNGHSK